MSLRVTGALARFLAVPHSCPARPEAAMTHVWQPVGQGRRGDPVEYAGDLLPSASPVLKDSDLPRGIAAP